MAKMRCRCGEVMSNVGFPNDLEHRLISDRLIDDVDCGRAAPPYDPDNPPMEGEEKSLGYLLFKLADRMWKCGACGRLHVFGDRESNFVTAVYVPEPVDDSREEQASG